MPVKKKQRILHEEDKSLSGTLAGGHKTRQTIIEKYGADYYKILGRLGGKASGTGGFYGNSERARTAGKLGGSLSSRKGVPMTLEHRKRMSEAQRARWKRIKEDRFLILDPEVDQPIIIQRKVRKLRWW